MPVITTEVKVLLGMFVWVVILHFWRKEKNIENFIADVLTLILVILVGIFGMLINHVKWIIMLIEVFSFAHYNSNTGKNEVSDLYATKSAIDFLQLILVKNSPSFFVDDSLLDGDGRVHKNKLA